MAKARKVPDRPLKYHDITAYYLDGTTAPGRAEGNNAAWPCKCGASLPLLGRCYYQFGWNCYSICPSCPRRYRVSRSPAKRAHEIREIV